MTRKPKITPVVLAAFLLGIAVGGFVGWRVPRENKSGEAASHGRSSGSDGEASSSARPKSPPVKFTPSGDPAADFRQITRMRDSASRTSAFRQLLSSMSPEAVANLMKTLKRFGEDQEQEDQIGGLMALMASRQLVIEHAAETDPQAVLTALAASGQAKQNGEYYKDVLRSWAARDPAAAQRFFEQTTLQDKAADAKGIAGAMVREMVKTDPEGTLRWLRGLKTSFTDDVAHDALQTLSHYDGEKAGKLLAQNGDLKKAPEFVAAMAAGWARTEPDKALAWALSLPPEISAAGIKTASAALAEKDFAAALASLSTLQVDQKAAALNGVVSTAGGSHLKELLPLVEGLPESVDRTAAVGSLVNTWADKSPEEAGTWLANQPAGPSRDQGAIVFALKSLDSDPEASLAWAASINANDQRQKGVDGLLDAWLKKDPKAARAWVQQSDRLSDADRARLLEKTGR
jgi:hypothetical protein